MEEQEEFEFAENEAAIYFEGNDLIVVFGDGRSATMTLERDDEKEVVHKVLSDVNTWAVFLQSLSSAIKQHLS